MLYTIESTFGGFGDVLVEIFALPKACLWGQCFASPANGDSVLLITDMAQFFRHEMADGGNHASVGCTARHKCVSMAESCHPYGFGGGYGGYGAFFGLQRPPLSAHTAVLT